MRLCMLAFPARQGARSVHGTLGSTAAYHGFGDLCTLLSDRIANGDAFPDEFAVRLPRGLSRRLLARGALERYQQFRDLLAQVEPSAPRMDSLPDTIGSAPTGEEVWAAITWKCGELGGIAPTLPQPELRTRQVALGDWVAQHIEPLLPAASQTHSADGVGSDRLGFCQTVRPWERIVLAPNTITAGA